MPDRRIVQCFGVKRRPGKEAKLCRRRFLWTARGASSGNFGGKGVQACPYCGTMPDFKHPYNKFLGGSITEEEAKAEMPAYIEKWKSENKP